MGTRRIYFTNEGEKDKVNEKERIKNLERFAKKKAVKDLNNTIEVIDSGLKSLSESGIKKSDYEIRKNNLKKANNIYKKLIFLYQRKMNFKFPLVESKYKKRKNGINKCLNNKK